MLWFIMELYLANCVVQFSLVALWCLTFATQRNAAGQASLSITILKLTQAHAHRVSDDIQTSHPLSTPSPAFNLSPHQGLFHRVSSLHQVTKISEFQLQHQSFQ